MFQAIAARTLLLALLLMPLSPANAGEQETWMRQYLHIGAGAYLPADKEMGSDSCIEMGYGINPFPFLGVEANIGYLQSQDLVRIATQSYNMHTMLLSLSGAVKALYPLEFGNVYLLAGGGMYFASLNLNGDQAAIPSPTTDNDVAFGYFYGAGAEIHAMKNLSFGFVGKKLEVSPTFDKLKASTLDSFSNRDFKGLQLLGTISYSY
jgi:opacity protein-like surface antigen